MDFDHRYIITAIIPINTATRRYTIFFDKIISRIPFAVNSVIATLKIAFPKRDGTTVQLVTQDVSSIGQRYPYKKSKSSACVIHMIEGFFCGDMKVNTQPNRQRIRPIAGKKHSFVIVGIQSKASPLQIVLFSKSRCGTMQRSFPVMALAQYPLLPSSELSCSIHSCTYKGVNSSMVLRTVTR